MMHHRVVLTVCALAVVPTIARAQAGCANLPSCYETASFIGTVSDFRASVEGGARLITATIRLQNRTTRPLVLGFVDGSGIVTDDQGNRYQVALPQSVRGIGVITSSTYDPKFQLQPGERADARIEFMFRPPSRGTILGTTYTLELAVREILPMAGNQWRLGREHALRFSGFDGSGMTTRVAHSPNAAAPAPASAGVGPGGTIGTGGSGSTQLAIPEEIDACAGIARCYASGPVRADIVQVSASDLPGNRHHGLRLNVRIRNVSAEPIIVGYKGTSSSAIDNLGNRYYFGRAGTHDVSSSGIGLVTSQQADPQLALRPGESRNAVFNLTRYDVGRSERGTSFTWNATLVQLEILPSRQVRTGREFAVQVADVSPTAGDAVKAAGNDAANKAARSLIDALSKRKKPPTR